MYECIVVKITTAVVLMNACNAFFKEEKKEMMLWDFFDDLFYKRISFAIID